MHSNTLEGSRMRGLQTSLCNKLASRHIVPQSHFSRNTGIPALIAHDRNPALELFPRSLMLIRSIGVYPFARYSRFTHDETPLSPDRNRSVSVTSKNFSDSFFMFHLLFLCAYSLFSARWSVSIEKHIILYCILQAFFEIFLLY